MAQAGLAVAVLFLAGLRAGAASTNISVSTNVLIASAMGTNAKAAPNPAEAEAVAALVAEQNRKDLEAAARRNLGLIATQLAELEAAYKREIQRARDTGPFSDQTMWMIVAALASLSLILALGFGWAHRNTLRRLTDELQDLRLRADVLSEDFQERGESSSSARPSPAGSKTSGSTGEELPDSCADSTSARVSENKAPAPASPAPVVAPAEPAPAPPSAVDVILGKAKTFENLGQMEPALACYDEALAIAPQHAETLVKKGKALEQLERLEPALEAYDHAIVADPSLASAHLLKAGVLNRLGRYNEAMKCYDLALRARHTDPTP